MTAASADAVVGVRIPQDMKEYVAAVAERAGLNISDLLRMFLKRVYDDGRLPFDPFERSDAIRLGTEDSELLAQAFQSPHKPNPAMQRAARRHKELLIVEE